MINYHMTHDFLKKIVVTFLERPILFFSASARQRL